MEKRTIDVGNNGDYSLSHWKVQHPTAPNNIPQMASWCHQPYFCAGGNQTCFYLGQKSNACITPTAPRDVLSRSEKIQLEAMRSIGRNVDMSLPVLVLGSHHM